MRMCTKIKITITADSIEEKICELEYLSEKTYPVFAPKRQMAGKTHKTKSMDSRV